MSGLVGISDVHLNFLLIAPGINLAEMGCVIL